MRKLELLAPAKNLEVGIAAIDHGADAVYIGASHHGARAAAGNSLEDIKTLCDYAHQYGAAVHVTVNTIVYEDEVEDTLSLIRNLQEIGVDAILVQDMGILKALKEEDIKLSLHSSTQCDTRTSEKVAWLSSLGFDRVVLARELSLEEIREIHEKNPEVELEAFVHGALCVSYSGVCYASQYCFQRSANRGECAQFCRLAFDLKDDNGRTIEHQRHLLSLKDMCQIENLEDLADAGASAFKIEGRLKDADYVKNVVAAYSKKLDEIVKHRPNEYCRASRGSVHYEFEPDLAKTFNRGYTTYFANGRQPQIANFDTPKALGEYVGRVKEIRRDSFNVAGTASFANGDGLCYLNPVAGEGDAALVGFRVNKAVGNRIFPFRMPQGLKPGMKLYRSHDEAFDKILSGKTAERKLPVDMAFGLTEEGFKLVVRHPASYQRAESSIVFEHQPAKKPQKENILRQLSKLGNTIYEAQHIEIEEGADQYFIPSSLLADLRRDAFEALSALEAQPSMNKATEKVSIERTSLNWQPEYQKYSYLYNISNPLARDFYQEQGMKDIRPAFEVMDKEALQQEENLIMQCRHCIRYSLGYCVKRGGKKPTWKEPLRLQLPDGRKFRLEFKCAECQMDIVAEL